MYCTVNILKPLIDQNWLSFGGYLQLGETSRGGMGFENKYDCVQIRNFIQ